MKWNWNNELSANSSRPTRGLRLMGGKPLTYPITTLWTFENRTNVNNVMRSIHISEFVKMKQNESLNSQFCNEKWSRNVFFVTFQTLWGWVQVETHIYFFYSLHKANTTILGARWHTPGKNLTCFNSSKTRNDIGLKLANSQYLSSAPNDFPTFKLIRK